MSDSLNGIDMTPVRDNMNLMELTVPQFISIVIDSLVAEKYNKPIVGLGPTGIGKTEGLIKTLATEKIPYTDDNGQKKEVKGIKVFEIRLINYDPSDIVGLPMINEQKQTVHAISKLLPPSDYELPCVVLFDEVTSAIRSLRTTCYQLMDVSRKVDEYKFPKRALIVAFGNGPHDGGDFKGMEAAFLSRGPSYRVRDDVNLWLKWASKNGIHPAVIAFLETYPTLLREPIDNKTVKESDLMACPRTWTTLSERLCIFEEKLRSKIGAPLNDNEKLEIRASVQRQYRGRGLSQAEIDKKYQEAVKKIEEARKNVVVLAFSEDNKLGLDAATKGSVGVRVGEQFLAFYSSSQYLPNIFDILEGKITAKQSLGVDKYKDSSVKVTEIVATLISSVVGQINSEIQIAMKNNTLPVKDPVDITMKSLPENLKGHILNAIRWCIGLGEISNEYGAQAVHDLFEEGGYLTQLLLADDDTGLSYYEPDLTDGILGLLISGRKVK